MKFKDMFDKTILTENPHVRKSLKIFYEIRLNLIKPKQEAPQQPVQQTPDQSQQMAPQQPAETTPVEPAQPETPQPVQEPAMDQSTDTQSIDAETNSDIMNALSQAAASVVTEDEEGTSVNDSEKVIRSYEGVVKLTDNQKDNMQSFEDLLDVLAEVKKNGDSILDDFCIQVITLIANQKFDEVKNLLDKESKIWIEIYFGFEKDDSIGVRFNKRQNGDLITCTLLINNEIVSTRFNISTVNQKIAEFRNYDVKKK